MSDRENSEARRAADRAAKAAARAAEKVLVIPSPEDPRRRKRLEKEPRAWLRFYLAEIFRDPFRAHHDEMIAAIHSAAAFAGDQSIAAPRGEAKTTIAECVLLYEVLRGAVDFAVLFAATRSEAAASLASIKGYLVESDRLAADYPEVVLPARDATGSPQRAHSMLVSGKGFTLHPAQFTWHGAEISMPAVPGSACSGAIIATRGLDSAVRGLKRGTRRPQIAVIDDPDTERTARNPDQARKLSERIEQGIAGLAAPGKRMSRVMLTTLQNKICASAQFTDPAQKPSWNGKRFSFLLSPPADTKAWDAYIRLRRESMAAGDQFGRAAHKVYVKSRKAMDRGAAVCNPKSFDPRKLPDRSQLQVSAIQRYYDFVADNGLDAALCELQNDPPEPSKGRLALRTAEIAGKLNSLDRGLVPLGAQVLTAHCDVHDRLLYYAACAWEPDFTGYVLDYGTEPKQPYSHFAQASAPIGLGDEHPEAGKEAAILAGLNALAARLLAVEWRREDGAVLRIGRLLVDMGHEPDVVSSFARRSPHAAVILPAKGFYIRPGVEWHTYFASKKGGQTGFHWRLPPPAEGNRFVLFDADWWKGLAAERLRVAVGDPGCWSLFGRPGDERQHALFAEHCTAEVPEWRQQGEAGKWHWELPPNRPDNHFWDTLIGAAVAASMLGVKIPAAEIPAQSGRRRRSVRYLKL